MPSVPAGPALRQRRRSSRSRRRAAWHESVQSIRPLRYSGIQQEHMLAEAPRRRIGQTSLLPSSVIWVVTCDSLHQSCIATCNAGRLAPKHRELRFHPTRFPDSYPGLRRV